MNADKIEEWAKAMDKSDDNKDNDLMFIRYPVENAKADIPDFMEYFPETLEYGYCEFRTRTYENQGCCEWLEEKVEKLNIGLSDPPIQIYSDPNTLMPMPGTIVECGCIIDLTKKTDVVPMTPDILGDAILDCFSG